jgi:hypothetical protein
MGIQYVTTGYATSFFIDKVSLPLPLVLVVIS